MLLQLTDVNKIYNYIKEKSSKKYCIEHIFVL